MIAVDNKFAVNDDAFHHIAIRASPSPSFSSRVAAETRRVAGDSHPARQWRKSPWGAT